MRVRWFGEAWGIGGPAPICDDMQYQIDTPVGTKCLECARQINERDRGVVTACSPNVWGSWNFVAPEGTYRVCSYHLACWLEQVVGGEMSVKMSHG